MEGTLPPGAFAGGEELDAGETGGAHQVALRREEPTGLCRSLDYELLGRAIGCLNTEELENAGHAGVVEQLVADRSVAPQALLTAPEAHQ